MVGFELLDPVMPQLGREVERVVVRPSQGPTVVAPAPVSEFFAPVPVESPSAVTGVTVVEVFRACGLPRITPWTSLAALACSSVVRRMARTGGTPTLSIPNGVRRGNAELADVRGQGFGTPWLVCGGCTYCVSFGGFSYVVYGFEL